MLVLPALDYRYSWSSTPTYLVIVGDALVALCFAIAFLAYKRTRSRPRRLKLPRVVGLPRACRQNSVAVAVHRLDLV